MSPAAAVSLGEFDDFQDASLENWAVGSISPVPPLNVASGGPEGTNDRYLLLRSLGTGGPGGKLVAFNSAQWSGDFLTAGVTEIRMQVRNLGDTDLALRLVIEGAGGQSLGTRTVASLPTGGDWTSVSFSLASADLSGGDYATVLGSVTTLNLLHSPSLAIARSQAPTIAAQLGVDNIAAVPEPAAVILMVLGLAGLTWRARVSGGLGIAAGRNGAGT